ncbi:glycosyl hydrolase, partial [Verminephrobacter aporrectodeae subsp. tuberculatae]
ATPNVNDATNTIDLKLTGVTDDAHNPGVGSVSSANYTVDTRPADTTGPTTATIALTNSALKAGQTTTVTITFTEPVSDLDVSDFVVPNGSLSAPTANADRTVWTSTFTPTATPNVNDATNTIDLKLTGVTDDAHNPGVGSVSSANYTVDTRPADTIGPTTATVALANSALTAGQTTTVTITFTEPISGLDVGDFVVPNGSLSTPAANADRTVWTSTFTPTATPNVNDATNTID